MLPTFTTSGAVLSRRLSCLQQQRQQDLSANVEAKKQTKNAQLQQEQQQE
jgi:hypothetical protein